jgi:hypothetical protein
MGAVTYGIRPYGVNPTGWGSPLVITLLAGGGMNQTCQNSAQVLSVGIFFTLLIIGLASSA